MKTYSKESRPFVEFVRKNSREILDAVRDWFDSQDKSLQVEEENPRAEEYLTKDLTFLSVDIFRENLSVEASGILRDCELAFGIPEEENEDSLDSSDWQERYLEVLYDIELKSHYIPVVFKRIYGCWERRSRFGSPRPQIECFRRGDRGQWTWQRYGSGDREASPKENRLELPELGWTGTVAAVYLPELGWTGTVAAVYEAVPFPAPPNAAPQE